MTKPVLIIEDDPDIAESLRISLENESVDTRVALTGEEGLSASLDKHSPPAAILLDLLLPGMNGVEICRRLRCESNTRTTPIIFLTAKTSDADVHGCFDAGADDYITKPFSIRAVMNRIHVLIARQQRRRGFVYDDKGFRIDFDQQRVFRNEVSLPLLGLDFALFFELVTNRNHVTTLHQLATTLWDQTEGVPHWAMDITIRRLNFILSVCGDAIELVSENSYQFVGAQSSLNQYILDRDGNRSTRN